jgi:hypothetical protein
VYLLRLTVLQIRDALSHHRLGGRDFCVSSFHRESRPKDVSTQENPEFDPLGVDLANINENIGNHQKDRGFDGLGGHSDSTLNVLFCVVTCFVLRVV